MNPGSHGKPSSTHFVSTAISFAVSGSAFGGGIRSSSSLLATRLTSSLIAALPGTAAFDLSNSSRVSNETAPL